MKGFLEAALQSWNPVAAVRRRLIEGTLSVSEVLVSSSAAVVACQSLANGAHLFFLEALASAGLPVPPTQLAALKNPIGQGVLSALPLLISVGVLYLLPLALFAPYRKSQVAAAVLLVAAAWSVYGATLGAPIYTIAALAASTDVRAGAMIYFIAGAPAAVVIALTTLVVWFKVSRSVLRLRWLQVLLFLFVPVVCTALMAWGLIVLMGIPGAA